MKIVRFFSLCMLCMCFVASTVWAQPNAETIYHVLPTADVVIDVGHGGIDSGTLHGDLFEKKINLEIAKLTYKMLLKKKIHPLLNRNDDRALSDDNRWLNIRSRHLRDLAQRKQLANDLKPRMMISLHANWSPDQTKRGAFVLYQNNEQSKRLALIMQQSLNRLYGIEESPALSKRFYLLNHTHCPTVIVEMGYISNPEDREWLTSSKKQKEIAVAICAAIEQYLHSDVKMESEERGNGVASD